MPIIRNPFRKSPADVYTDQTLPAPASSSSGSPSDPEVSGIASKPLSIRSNGKPKQPTEYQLSEINDSGVFVPPSPPDTKSSFWSTRSGASTRSSSHRSVLNENEPFNISRESFDSYRRSFDISARSPVLDASSTYSRKSLEARQLRLPISAQSPVSSPKHQKISPPIQQEQNPTRRRDSGQRPFASPYQPKILTALTDKHINPPVSEPEESEDALPAARDDAPVDRFEDVGLGEDPVTSKRLQQPQYQPAAAAKKPGMFARFTGTAAGESSAAPPEGTSRPGSSGLGIGIGNHSFFGRKRGTSGQGAELGQVPMKSTPNPAPAQEVRVDS